MKITEVFRKYPLTAPNSHATLSLVARVPNTCALGRTSLGRVTIRDIARELDLSHTTVSRVLNGREDINIPERTRLKVLEAAQSMGYQPNRAARALATGKSSMITFLTANSYAPYYVEALRHSERWLEDHGFGVNSRSMHGPRLLDWISDGVLALDRSSDDVAQFLGGQRLSETPVVYLGSVDAPCCDRVVIALYPAAREAVESLVSSGRRHIVYIHQPRNDEGARPQAYFDVLNEAGLRPALICSDGDTRQSTRNAVLRYAETHGCPDGIFAEDDDLAIGAYCAVRDLGRRIPEDAAVIGCDGVIDTDCLATPLSTIQIPIADMCRCGCELLLRRIEDPQAEIQEKVMQGRFVRKESS